MTPLPSLHRVIPAHGAIKTEWILPYDDVKKLMESCKTFAVEDCVCRKQQDLLGSKKCNFPINNCMRFSKYERPPRKGDISKEEALALLDETERIGLVHTVSNVMEGLNYMCNCCGCCCGILRGVTDSWRQELGGGLLIISRQLRRSLVLGVVCVSRGVRLMRSLWLIMWQLLIWKSASGVVSV